MQPERQARRTGERLQGQNGRGEAPEFERQRQRWQGRPAHAKKRRGTLGQDAAARNGRPKTPCGVGACCPISRADERDCIVCLAAASLSFFFFSFLFFFFFFFFFFLFYCDVWVLVPPLAESCLLRLVEAPPARLWSPACDHLAISALAQRWFLPGLVSAVVRRAAVLSFSISTSPSHLCADGSRLVKWIQMDVDWQPLS